MNETSTPRQWLRLVYGTDYLIVAVDQISRAFKRRDGGYRLRLVDGCHYDIDQDIETLWQTIKRASGENPTLSPLPDTYEFV